MDVLYIPPSLYPGCILYKDKTISSTQSDVKAHHEISLQNDQFNSGTNIDFKSGDRIDINDAVTVNNGSSVDFIVDPSYW